MRTDVTGWLQRWQALIAAQHFEAAAELFLPEAQGFGTVTDRTRSLTELVERQWRRVWTRTSAFRFDLDSLVLWGEGEPVVVGVMWTSTGRDAVSGAPFDRHGRATIVLRRIGPALKAVHTHFSLVPAPERFLPTDPASP